MKIDERLQGILILFCVYAKPFTHTPHAFMLNFIFGVISNYSSLYFQFRILILKTSN